MVTEAFRAKVNAICFLCCSTLKLGKIVAAFCGREFGPECSRTELTKLGMSHSIHLKLIEH